MEVAILCGGKGMRLNGGTTPKALAEVKGRPLMQHVMNIYGEKKYDYSPRSNSFYLLTGHHEKQIRLHYLLDPDPYVECIFTGYEQQTAERLMIAKYKLGKYERLWVAYTDCLANVNIEEVTKFHRGHGKLATLVAVRPLSTYGVLRFRESDPAFKGLSNEVASFAEKPQINEWVSAGFFIFEHDAWPYFELGKVLEKEPLEALARDGQLMAYTHSGFFRCVDTQKDLEELNAMEGTPWLRKA